MEGYSPTDYESAGASEIARHLVQGHPAPTHGGYQIGDMMQIFIVTLTGKKLCLTVSNDDKIDDILTRVLKFDWVHQSQLRLAEDAGGQLDGSITLREANIGQDASLRLVQRGDLTTQYWMKGPRFTTTMHEMQDMYIEVRNEVCQLRRKNEELLDRIQDAEGLATWQLRRVRDLEGELAELRENVARMASVNAATQQMFDRRNAPPPPPPPGL